MRLLVAHASLPEVPLPLARIAAPPATDRFPARDAAPHAQPLSDFKQYMHMVGMTVAASTAPSPSACHARSAPIIAVTATLAPSHGSRRAVTNVTK